MLTDNHRMESISRAYIQAIAGSAGLNLKLEQGVREFDYGIDGTFHPVKSLNGNLVESGFPLDFQLKATTNWKLDNDHVTYTMSAKAYNKIVDRNNNTRAIPTILILLCLPKDSLYWLESDENQLLLRKCCYWKYLTGNPTKNTEGVTIRIPRFQYLMPKSVIELLEKVEQGILS
jgi:hypothetical protein